MRAAPGRRWARAAGRGALALGVALAAALQAAAAAAAEAVPPAQPGRWVFAVTLDERPIGQHRFELERDGPEGWLLRSEAAYDVKLLGLTVYRYRHSATERWQGLCLTRLDARTDDNGEDSAVQWSAAAGDCVASYAYWSAAALRAQTRLLNPQTGALEPVQGSALPAAAWRLAGLTVPAQGWRLRTPKGPVDVWTAPDGRWVGLDATVSGDRRLRYRLP